MSDLVVYHIQLQGRVDKDEINSMSPLAMVCEQADATRTQFSVRTDQSGLVGLMRHLHGLGFVFLSVSQNEIADPGA
jgi:hypothetical protein